MLNLGFLIFLPAQIRRVEANGAAPVLRGCALESIDEKGKARADLNVYPEDPRVKMPDGTTGYPETVMLRLYSSRRRPSVKISATEDRSGRVLCGKSNPTYA